MNAAWAAMPLLLATSALCSASETALFALNESERERAPPIVERLLRQPQALLVTVLLTNLAVNALFFATASRLADHPSLDPALVLPAALVVLVLFGELLPKAVALLARERVARLVALPLTALVTASGPPRRALQGLLELARRAFGELGRPEQGVSTEALARVLASSAKSGLIEAGEADLLTGIVELETIRVRQVFTPRVDMLALDLSDTDEERRWFTLARALARRLGWLPVVRGGADEVVGIVRLRDVLGKPESALEQLVQPAVFIPESASLLDLVRVLREKHAAEAIVVDEYGGTAGQITLEQAFEEIVGDLRVEGELAAQAVTDLGGGRFLVAGRLSIRDWNGLFGHRVVPDGFETVGGLVTALLGRLPRAGDRVRMGDLAAIVRAVSAGRVESVEISAAPSEAA